MLRRLGTLPIAAINIGVAAAPTVLASAAAGVAVDIAGIAPALAAQVAFAAVPPSAPLLAARVATWVTTRNLSSLATLLTPATWLTLGATANLSVVAKLGIIDAELAIAARLVGEFQAGLESGGLAGWTYAGFAPGFGTGLEAASRQGRRDLPPETPVQAVILATHDFGSWRGLSGTINTGDSDEKDLGSKLSGGTLTFQGYLGGGQWNTGLFRVMRKLEMELLKLRGMKAWLEAQLAFTLGLNLPNPKVLLDASLDIDIEAALGSISFGLDLTATLGALEAKADALLKLSADLRASLNISGGGLTAWSYSGPFGSLGSEFAAEIANGLPGVNDPRGACYGLVIACASPSAWADFGLIFKT